MLIVMSLGTFWLHTSPLPSSDRNINPVYLKCPSAFVKRKFCNDNITISHGVINEVLPRLDNINRPSAGTVSLLLHNRQSCDCRYTSKINFCLWYATGIALSSFYYAGLNVAGMKIFVPSFQCLDSNETVLQKYQTGPKISLWLVPFSLLLCQQQS